MRTRHFLFIPLLGALPWAQDPALQDTFVQAKALRATPDTLMDAAKALSDEGFILPALGADNDNGQGLLVVGTRNDADYGEYPDIDMKFLEERYAGQGGFVHKDGTPY